MVHLSRHLRALVCGFGLVAGVAQAGEGAAAVRDVVSSGDVVEPIAPSGGTTPAPVGLPPSLHAPASLPDERWTLPASALSSVRSARGGTLGERMVAASRAFLGVPYLRDAAGEGSAEDADAPAAYERFDCMTFMEEIVGMAVMPDPLYAPLARSALRWKDGRVAYEARRHFMEGSWVPDAVRNGLMVDVTDRVGRARTLQKTVTPGTWAGWRRRGLFRLPDEVLPVGTWRLRYLDLAEALRSVDRFPPGAVLLTLREPRAGLPYAVTHVSLVMKDGKRVRMHHASRMGAQRVRDDDLRWYLAHLAGYPRWPAIGVTVLMPREVGPRRSIASSLAWQAPALPDAEGPPPVMVHVPPSPSVTPPTAVAPGATPT